MIDINKSVIEINELMIEITISMVKINKSMIKINESMIEEDILDNFKEDHACSVQFLLGGEIRITFESALDRDAVLCRGPLELKGVRCRFMEIGSPLAPSSTFLIFRLSSRMTLSGWLWLNTVRLRACVCSTSPGILALPLARAWWACC